MEETGEVCSAHCNCMAGLGETCTHVAAILFYLEAAARIQGKETTTQQKCEWIMPSFKKKCQYLPVKDIDFTSARGKKRKFDDAINCESTAQNESQTMATPHRLSPLTPASENIDDLYKAISECDTKPAILSLADEYSTSYVPKRFLDNFPQPLSLLYQPAYMELEYHMLLKECESVKIQISEEMALAVEKETRSQSKFKL